MPEKINKPLLLVTRLLTGIVILALAIGIAFYLFQTRPQIEQSPMDQTLLQVQVLKVAQVPVNLQWSGYGNTSAINQCEVPARVMSTVQKIPADLDAGVVVKAGDLLVQLDPSDFLQQQQIAQQSMAQIQANLQKLDTEESYLKQQKLLDQADVQLSKNEWERAKNLYHRKAATQQDMDRSHQTYLTKQRGLLKTSQQLAQIENRRTELQAQLDSQKATLARGVLDVQRCRITSPINGVLQKLNVELGENVSLGMAVARIVNLERIEVALQLPASARPAIRVGDRVELMPVGSTAVSWKNKITRIAPEDDPTTRTLSVYIEIQQASNRDKQLAPGRYVQGTVHAHQAIPLWLVPTRSVQADRIMVVRNGRVRSLPAKSSSLIKKQFDGFALTDTRWVVLGAALESGDMIIITPSRLVSEGKAVDPVVMADQSLLIEGRLP